MRIKDLIDKLAELDEDGTIIFTDFDGGWTNIALDISTNSLVSIVPVDNAIFTDDK